MSHFVKAMELHSFTKCLLSLHLHTVTSWMPLDRGTVHLSFISCSECTCSVTQQHKELNAFIRKHFFRCPIKSSSGFQIHCWFPWMKPFVWVGPSSSPPSPSLATIEQDSSCLKSLNMPKHCPLFLLALENQRSALHPFAKPTDGLYYVLWSTRLSIQFHYIHTVLDKESELLK